MTVNVNSIEISRILPNPANPRSMNLPKEIEGVEALKRSIAKAGFNGDPITVVEITGDVLADYFGSNSTEAAASGATHMVLAGHRRLAAMEALFSAAIEKGELDKANERYGSIPCLVLKGGKREQVMRATLTNYNRVDLDFIGKAQNAETIRMMARDEKIAAVMAKAKKDDAWKESETLKLRGLHDVGQIVKDSELATLLNCSPSTVSRFRVVLGFPDEIQVLFRTGALKEANTSDVAAAINKKITVEAIMATVTGCGKDATYKKLADAIRALYMPKDHDPSWLEGEGEVSGSKDPERTKAAADLLGHFEQEDGAKAANGKDRGVTVTGKMTDEIVSAILGRLDKAGRKACEPLVNIMKGATLTTTTDGMRTLINFLDIGGEGAPVAGSEIDESPFGE